MCNIKHIRGIKHYFLSIHIIVATDIEEDDFLFGYQNGKGYSVTVGKADGVTAVKFTEQRMQFQAWLERIFLKISEYFSKSCPQVGVFFEKFAGLTEKLPRRNDAEH